MTTPLLNSSIGLRRSAVRNPLLSLISEPQRSWNVKWLLVSELSKFSRSLYAMRSLGVLGLSLSLNGSLSLEEEGLSRSWKSNLSLVLFGELFPVVAPVTGGSDNVEAAATAAATTSLTSFDCRALAKSFAIWLDSSVRNSLARSFAIWLETGADTAIKEKFGCKKLSPWHIYSMAGGRKQETDET